MTVPVYRAELLDGLGEVLQTNCVAAVASLAVPSGPVELTPNVLARATAAAGGQPDLYYGRSLMVSTGANQNLDYFDPAETWAARATPEDKPLNDEHDEDFILGVVNGVGAVDDDGKAIASDTPLDELPSSFHFVTPWVVWRIADGKERQERINKAIAEVDEGKRFVSMECRFRDFDYLLLPKDAEWSDVAKAKFVRRNKDTAFLTKHIAAFGGTGVHGDYRVGRVFRNFVFTGLALVKTPANPKSVIYKAGAKTFVASASSAFVDSFATNCHLSAAAGYSTGDRQPEPVMPDTDKQLAEVTAKLDKALADLAAAREGQTQAKVTELTQAVASANEVSATLKTELDSAKAAAETAEKTVAELKTELETAKARLTALEGEKAKAEKDARDAKRLATVKSAYGVEDDEAKAIAANLEALTDEQFAAHAETMKAKLAPKVPTPVSDKPAPAANGNPKVSAKATLEAAKPDAKPDLVTAGDGGETDKVNATRKSIAGFMTATRQTKPKNTKTAE
jgi:hypothetical protein